MAKPSPLTIGFIEKRPRAAAQTLTEMEPEDAAALLEAIPARYNAALLTEMNSWPASTLIARMTHENAAAALSEMEYPAAASVLRLIPETERTHITAALPSGLRRRFETTLSYPPDTVGAKMSTGIITLRPDQTVGEALTELRQIKRTKTGVVYIVDPARRFAGMVSAAEIVQRSNDTVVSDAMETGVTPLSARARLTSVSALPAWDEHGQLPVINRDKLLIGALSRKMVQKQERHQMRLAAVAANNSIASSIAGAFFHSALDLAQLLVGEGRPDTELDAKPQKQRQRGQS